MSDEISVIHVLRIGEPKCPKCGQGLEEDGGSVVRAGSWDWGPLWFECQDCTEINDYGYEVNLQWGFA